MTGKVGEGTRVMLRPPSSESTTAVDRGSAGAAGFAGVVVSARAEALLRARLAALELERLAKAGNLAYARRDRHLAHRP